jgi:serine/threonine protein kinase
LKNEIYAAKVLSLENATDRHRELVKREIDILKLQDHPNVVQYKYHVVLDKTACLVMDYCGGGTLYQHIQDLKRDSKVMDEKEFLETLTQISKGVEVKLYAFICLDRILLNASENKGVSITQ